MANILRIEVNWRLAQLVVVIIILAAAIWMLISGEPGLFALAMTGSILVCLIVLLVRMPS